MTDTETAEQQDTDTNERLVYELGFHVVPTFSEEELPEAVNRVKSVLESRGAEIIAEEFPQKMELAYTMEKTEAGKKQRYDSAYFGWVAFELEPEKAQEANEELRGSDDLLRFLLIRTSREQITAGRGGSKPEEPHLASDDLPAQAGPSSDEAESDVSQEELDKSIDALVGEEK